MRKTRPLRATLLALACSLSMAAFAQGGDVKSIDIPPGDLVASLQALARQSGAELAYREDLLAGLRTPGARGALTAEQALEKLLKGTGFTARRDPSGALMIVKDDAPAPKAGPAATGGASSRTSQPEAPVTNIAAMTVTGSRIRGGATPSPVITVTAAQIEEEGFSDLGDVIRSVPQNYGGGQNPGVTAGAGAGGYYNQNVSGGSAANLRALGQDATLTLLNGRRMSYGAYDQSVDISAIPVDAVERIEIVTDGASAIYGSDAVAGVVNVILKRDFDGMVLGSRYGKATQGGLDTQEYTATAGTTWPSGGLIATWKKSSNDPIYANQRDYTGDVYEHTTLYQGGDQRSGLLSAYQSLGDSIELQLDALRTERGKLTEYGYSSVYYYYPTETTTSVISPSVVFSLPGDWTLNASAALGKDKTEFHAIGTSQTTGETTLNRSFSYQNKSRTYEVDAEGPLFAVPGGDARLAVGAGYRYNDFLYLYIGDPVADGDEGSRFAYAELNLPLVGPDQDVAGVSRLELTSAIRAEDYDSYGQVTTPKFGLLYSPGKDLTLKASWGKSFKAPTLYQRYIYQYSYLYPVTSLGGTGYESTATALYLNGGNEELEPERAKTRSVSLAYHPEALPGLEAELTWFSIDYTDRIVQPITVTSTSVANPAYTDFVTLSPTSDFLEQILAITTFTNYTSWAYDPDSVVAVVDNRFVNAARQRVNGIDLSGAYRFDLGPGRLAVRGSVSWLDSERALTATSDYSDVSGVLFYPAKVASRVGVVWNQGGFTASVFGNYRSGVTNTTDDTKGASFTTFDTALRYDTGEREDIFANLAFEFSAQNLLNRDPPLYAETTLSNVPYDSTNYSAIGRFLSVAVSKRW